MSKWIKKDLFEQFVEEKQNEETSKKPTSRRSDMVWQTPAMGTQDKPKVYEVRLLPDPKGQFYKRFYYHGFKSGDRWYFPLCEKTNDFYNWCPFCAAASKLYTGTQADKLLASSIKRKEKFVGNVFVIDDPRDGERDAENKVVNTVKLYEFPNEVEQKIKGTITDVKHGLGASVFDPSDEGYNFIVKVRATKPTKEGKTWPVYADSEFARKSSALGTDKEIQKIMEKTFDINDYVATQMMSNEDIIALMKNEMLWDLVKDEWSRYKGKTPNGVKTASESAEKALAEKKEAPKSTPKKGEEDVPDHIGQDDAADADLLKELDEL